MILVTLRVSGAELVNDVCASLRTSRNIPIRNITLLVEIDLCLKLFVSQVSTVSSMLSLLCVIYPIACESGMFIQAEIRRHVCPDPAWRRESEQIIAIATGQDIFDQLGATADAPVPGVSGDGGVVRSVADVANAAAGGANLDWSFFCSMFNCDWRSDDGPLHFCARSCTDRATCCHSEQDARNKMKRAARQQFCDVFNGMESTKKWLEGARTSARLAPLAKCCKLLARAARAWRRKPSRAGDDAESDIERVDDDFAVRTRKRQRQAGLFCMQGTSADMLLAHAIVGQPARAFLSLMFKAERDARLIAAGVSLLQQTSILGEFIVHGGKVTQTMALLNGLLLPTSMLTQTHFFDCSEQEALRHNRAFALRAIGSFRQRVWSPIMRCQSFWHFCGAHDALQRGELAEATTYLLECVHGPQDTEDSVTGCVPQSCCAEPYFVKKMFVKRSNGEDLLGKPWQELMVWQMNTGPILSIVATETSHVLVEDQTLQRWRASTPKRVHEEAEKLKKIGNEAAAAPAKRRNQYSSSTARMASSIQTAAAQASKDMSRKRNKPGVPQPLKHPPILHFRNGLMREWQQANPGQSMDWETWQAFIKSSRERFRLMPADQQKAYAETRGIPVVAPCNDTDESGPKRRKVTKVESVSLPPSAYRAGTSSSPVCDEVINDFVRRVEMWESKPGSYHGGLRTVSEASVAYMQAHHGDVAPHPGLCRSAHSGLITKAKTLSKCIWARLGGVVGEALFRLNGVGDLVNGRRCVHLWPEFRMDSP